MRTCQKLSTFDLGSKEWFSGNGFDATLECLERGKGTGNLIGDLVSEGYGFAE